MVMQRAYFERAQSIAGGALVAVGILILRENLGQSAGQLSRIAGNIPREALGASPSLILATSRMAGAYAADHRRFLLALLHHVLASSWPLVLVVAGTVLSRNAL